MYIMADDWHYLLTDALGSVHSLVSASQNVASVQSYDPYGNPESHYGAGFGFTGEQTDENGQLYLRARYYNPSLGVFPSLDPFEGLFDRPMSLNGYAWVEGNPINLTDASGMCPQNPHPWDLFGRRCQALAYGLAARTGISVDTFMTLNYIQLEGLTALRTMGDIGMELERLMNNATVLPRLFREDPQRALQALEMVACQNEGTLMGGMALAALIPMSGLAQAGALGAGVTATGGSSAIGGGLTATGIGSAIEGGVLLGVGAVLLWEHLIMSTGAIALPHQQTTSFTDSSTYPKILEARFQSENFNWSNITDTAIAALTVGVVNPVVLYRGGSLNSILSPVYEDKLWLSEFLWYVTIYSDSTGSAERDTSAIAVYTIPRTVLTSLCHANLVTPCTSTEYGFTQPATNALIGPLVVPVPDNFTGR